MRANETYEFITQKALVFELADVIVDKIGEITPGSDKQRIAKWPVDTDGIHYSLERHDCGDVGKLFTLRIGDGDRQIDQISIQRSGRGAYKIYRLDENGYEVDADAAAQTELEEKAFAILSTDGTIVEKATQTMVDGEFVRLAGRLMLSPYALLSPDGMLCQLNRSEPAKLVADYEQLVKETDMAVSKPQSTEKVTFLDIHPVRLIGDAANELMASGGRWQNAFDDRLPPSQRIQRADR